MDEYVEVLDRLGCTPRQLRLWTEWFSHETKVTRLQSPANVEACRDPKDDIFLAATAASEAPYLVTLDKDLLTLAKFEDTNIVKPSDFLRLLKLT